MYVILFMTFELSKLCSNVHTSYFFKVSSNFDNEGDRHFVKEKVAGLTYKKPLMYFCFDVMKGMKSVEGVEKTIALTCPHKSLTTATALAKCCPKGTVYILRQ